ncbi:MAG TPA: gamma-glutamyltransferase, partial [Ktedonobacterales bacterium]
TLTIVDPASNGIGGDAFALVWDGARLHGLNGSGRAPAALTIERVRAAGHDTMPDYGWLSVSVPGAPAAWRDLHERFGRLPFESLFEPAITYAEQGHPVSPISVWHWRWTVEQVHSTLHGAEYAAFMPLFAPSSRAPGVGEMWASPEMARSLRLIAETRAQAMYSGDLAHDIVRFAEQTGGTLTADDLARHTSTWVDPISTSYRGYDVWEIPPNTQGLAALLALNILEGTDLATLPRESAESFHLQLEAMKLAFADVERYVCDPEHVAVPVAELLAKPYTTARRALIRPEASVPVAGRPLGSDTVYLCTADADGTMVSFIQSLAGAFGSHVVVLGTGIVLQN